MKQIENGVTAPRGFLASGVIANIKGNNYTKKDLALIVSEKKATTVAVYTQNKVKGAPLIVTKQHLKNKEAKAIICNSGNANTCNSNGIEISEETCRLLSEELNMNKEDVVVASTGVIGQKMSIEPFKKAIPELVQSLHKNGSKDAANAIMTTDTKVKEIAYEIEIEGTRVRIGGIAKGSGMIHPNMATMLCFITSDISISKELLEEAFKEVIGDTYNMVSVDGDTSTNDMTVMMCNGMAENKKIVLKDKNYNLFKQALYQVCEYLSKAIAKDGEGATKLLTSHVYHAKNKDIAKIVSKSVITSNLFKAAMFGNDANWGRVLCAIGYSDTYVDIDKVDVSFKSIKGEISVCINGKGIDFDEEKALEILKNDEVIIEIDLKDGEAQATAWGCDLTYDYVKINGDYRT